LTESKPKISDLSSKLLKLETKLGTSQSKLEKVQISQNELRKEKTESKAKISELSSKLLQLEEGIVNNVTTL
jgi:peptidoglycan hydrolase CwlO-like protein